MKSLDIFPLALADSIAASENRVTMDAQIHCQDRNMYVVVSSPKFCTTYV